jgi:hypothetical protein
MKKSIEECIEILNKQKKSIDKTLMWNDDIMHDRYLQLEKQSNELSEVINYLKSKI